MNERKLIAMTARMEGDATIVRGIGRQVKVSEMELVVLANFAKIGLWCLFTRIESEQGETAKRELEEHLSRIQSQFSPPGGDDGLQRLSQSCTAMLHAGRFDRYLVQTPPAPGGGG